MPDTKVGVISCSGEECLGGTISRLATRRVVVKLRNGRVVTLCLPLFIAGGIEEREFAKKFPVIAVTVVIGAVLKERQSSTAVR